MANSDKNIIITPNIGSTTADPKITFSGADGSTAAQTITLNIYPTNSGTLSFEGSAGQLFSITNSLSGTIYSVNDVSGIPSIEVLDTGLVKLAQYSGNVLLGTNSDNGTNKLQVNGSISATGASVLNGLKLVSSGNDVSGTDASLWIQGSNNDWAVIIDKGSYDYGIRANMSSSHAYAFRADKAGAEYFRVGSDLMYHSASVRAPIFYDTDNTGYYIDSNSSSRMNVVNADTLRSYGNLYLDYNYGCTIVGVYSSYRYQGVFAMGDSYKLPADGTTTGNLYGMAWSHPNAGGVAGNLASHGLLLLQNGTFMCSLSTNIVASGNITAYSDERLKTNWKPMPNNFVENLSKVKVGIYERTDQNNDVQVGVSAQSLQKILPEAIMTSKDDMETLSISYGNAALASAVEISKEIVSLKQIIQQQQLQIDKLLSLTASK